MSVVPVAGGENAGVVAGGQKETFAAYCALILTALAGNASVSLKPILIGSYVEFLKYSASTAGYMVSAEASAMSLSTAVTAMNVDRWGRKQWTFTALVIIVAGNVLSLFVRSPAALAMARALAGIGHGMALAVTAACIASFSQPDRTAGIVTVGVSALGIVLIFLVPWAQAEIGIQPLFGLMALVAFPSLLLLRRMPMGHVNGGVQELATPRLTDLMGERNVVITLAAVAFFYLSVGSFWPFAEQVGRAAGLTYAASSRVIAFAEFASVLGALVAIWLGDRFGRLLPIGCSLTLAVAGLAGLLLVPDQPVVFSVAAIVYMFAWASMYPFLLGFASQLDPSGRVNGLVFSLSLIGLAVGPGVGSTIIMIGSVDGRSNIANLIWMSVFCLVASFAVLYAIRREGQR